MKNNATIDYLKFFFALGIVALHTGFLLDTQNGFYIHTIVFRLGVPFFFLTSGYYLAAKNKSNDNVTIKNYIKKLITPYLILSTCYLIINLVRNNTMTPGELLNGFWFILTGRSQSVIWFVGALITSCVILLHTKEERKLKISIIIAIVIYIIGLLFNTYSFLINNEYLDFFYNFLINNFLNNSNALFEGYLFVAIGYYLNKYKNNYVLKSNIIMLISGTIVLLFEVFLVHNHLDKVINYEYYLSHIVLIPNLFLFAKNVNIKCKSFLIRKLSSYIYYFHYLFIILLLWINDLHPNKLLSNNTCFYLITVGITIIYSITFYLFNKKSQIKKDIYKYVVIMLYTISFIALFFSLTVMLNKFVSADEINNLNIIKNDFKNLYFIIKNSNNSLLYYGILKIYISLFLKINSNLNIIILSKIFSVAPLFLTLFLINTKFKRNHGLIAAALLTFFLIFTQNLINRFTQIGVLGWGIFFTLSCYIYLIDAIKNQNKSSWLWFIIYSIFSIYTDSYFSVVIVHIYILTLIYLFVKNKYLIKRFLLSCLIVVVCALPNLFIIIKRLIKINIKFNTNMLAIANIKGYIKYIVWPYSDNKILNLLLGITWILCLLIIIIKFVKDNWKKDEMLLFTIGIIVLPLFIISNTLFCNIINTQIMIFSIGIFWISIALIYSKVIQQNSKFIALLITPILIGCINANNYIRTQLNQNDSTIGFYKKIINMDTNTDIYTNEIAIGNLITYLNQKSDIYILKDSIQNLENIDYTEKIDINGNTLKYYIENINSIDYKNTICKDGYELNYIDSYTIDTYNLNIYEIIKNNKKKIKKT